MKSLKRVLRILLILLIVGALAWAGLVAMVVWKEKHIPEIGEYDAIIILGAQVKPDGTPNLQLQWRLDAGLEAWKEHPCPIVVCGAQGADEPRPEADVMGDYLEARGVPAESIRRDSASYNTRQNIRNAAALLEGDGVRTVLIVTSDYHLARAVRIAEDAGFRASGLGSRTLGGYWWFKNHFREALSWVKYWLEGLTGRGG